MDPQTLRALLSPAGQEVLLAAQALNPQEHAYLQHFTRLSRRFPPELARAALETAILRQAAQAKFPDAGRMYFTRPALEQASNYVVASHRAGRYRSFERITDLGCSIGGDTLALAQAAPVFGLDRDPLRLIMAQENLRALDLGERAVFLEADLSAPLPLAPAGNLALFFDPARRQDHKRLFSVREYQPPLATLRAWLPRFPALGVKISPGVSLAELDAYEAEIEFVSLHGELKEAVLWFGPLKSAVRRATLLPAGDSLLAQAAPAAHSLPLSEPLGFLYEPDPAVLRAGLVGALGEQLGAAQLDPDIAYLTSHRRCETPFARSWAVDAWLPFGIKPLRQALKARRVGRVTVKKRGSPLQPEQLIDELRLDPQQPEQRLVFLTHLNGRPAAILCFP